MKEPSVRLGEMAELNRALAAGGGGEPFMNAVVDRAARLLEAKSVALALVDDQGQARIRASHGVDAGLAARFESGAGESLGLRICEALGCPAETFLRAPVIEAGSERGMLVAALTAPPRSGDEVAVLAALADTVAIALGRARLEQRLGQVLSELRGRERRKDEFLGKLSHELRNPLAPIRTALFLLQQPDVGDDMHRYVREVLERQTSQLTRLVDALLDVTQDGSKVQIRREDVDLAELLRHTVETQRGVIEEHGLRLRVEIPAEAAQVAGDSARLAQMLGNLLDNAAKFTPAGGEIGVTLRVLDTRVEIRIRDTGAGIDPALRARIFEPFIRGEAPAGRESEGQGLGLAIVKGVAQLHGGIVEAESAGVGEGSEFIVQLPRSRAPAPRRAKRVLVVDDNRDTAEMMARTVAVFGHKTAIAHDGPSALQMVRATQPEAVLCDIGMPGMNGYEFAKAVRAELGEGVKLIAVSGYARPAEVQKAMDAGFEAHVPKPPDPEVIDRLLA